MTLQSIIYSTQLFKISENIYIKDKSGDKFTVRRAQDKTKAAIHASGAAIKSITTADATYIDSGDNFGFDGSTF